MNWDLEERVEDAIAAYLKTKVSGAMAVFTAWAAVEQTYPCVVVHAGETTAVSETATWHNVRGLAVKLAVMTEAAPEMNAAGATIKTARERNAAARSSVMDAMATSTLPTLLNATGTPGVLFSMAQIGDTRRTVAERKFITEIDVEVIAAPQEIGA